MNNKDNKTAIAKQQDSIMACARSLANVSSIQATESQSASLKSSEGYLSNRVTTRSVTRGEHDAMAFKSAYHDPHIMQAHEPGGSLSLELYHLLERNRYEALGANQFEGARKNLDARQSKRGFDPQSARAAGEESIILSEFISTLCQQAFRSCDESSCDTPYISQQYAEIQRFSEPYLDRLSTMLDQQAQFSSLANVFAAKLSHWFQSGLSNESLSADDDAGSDSEEHVHVEPEESLVDAPGEEEATEQSESDVDGSEETRATEDVTETALDEAPAAGKDPVLLSSEDAGTYQVFTREFDQTIYAARWADPRALREWREQLDQHLALHGRLVRRLATRLQRVLLAQQNRRWQFNVEEGMLDTSRLTRIVTEPMTPLAFKVESEAAFRNTTITLLIDNSRSMMGRPITIAAACTDVLAQTLERCGVSVEILGFTTVHLHGGESTAEWERQGKPPMPGRLNDLRHIIYKSAHSSYRSARKNLGLMLDKDLLKQNIDGEALMWAYQRIMRRSAQRRILVVISDGAPVDTSTLSSNNANYLSDHLNLVIQQIERTREVELIAIGIGHDVSRFYQHAVSVFDAKQLGPVLLNQLEMLFTQAA